MCTLCSALCCVLCGRARAAAKASGRGDIAGACAPPAAPRAAARPDRRPQPRCRRCEMEFKSRRSLPPDSRGAGAGGALTIIITRTGLASAAICTTSASSALATRAQHVRAEPRARCGGESCCAATASVAAARLWAARH
eukprot:scaffold10482_cov116-Isochrysis_galbana.AAC.7